MTFIRTLVAAVLFMAWLPATNACTIANLVPDVMEDCCQSESDHDSGGCDGVKSCASCVALENGFQRDLLQPYALPVPTFAELVLLAQLFQTLRVEVENDLPPVRSDRPPLQAPLWLLVIRTALPVRGPSALA